MPMSGYTKLFSSILTSSVWGEADHTRLVWITLLALSDRYGDVMASTGGLARSANVTRDRCAEAISVLSSPDPEDRSGVKDGIRIEKIQGGWHIVNYADYRDKMRSVDRKEYLREKQREYRAIRKQSVNKSTIVNQCQPIATASTTTTTEAEAEEEKKGSLSLPGSLDNEDFRLAWEEWVAYRRERKLAAWKPRTIAAKLAELDEIGTPSAIAAIRNSISNGWQGIFPKKTIDATPAGGKCNRCSGTGFIEKPIPGSFGRDVAREPCTRCQGTGRF